MKKSDFRWGSLGQIPPKNIEEIVEQVYKEPLSCSCFYWVVGAILVLARAVIELRQVLEKETNEHTLKS
jgi:hypothetical protein